MLWALLALGIAAGLFLYVAYAAISTVHRLNNLDRGYERNGVLS